MPKACSRHATPATWSHQGRQFVLTATVSGSLLLIDPVDGAVRWRVDGLGENHFSLAPSESYVAVNGGSSLPRREGKDQRFGILAGYRITPQGATLAWKHPEKRELTFQTWMDSCARRFLAVDQGRIYYYPHGPEREDRRLHLLDEATGQVIAAAPTGLTAPQFYAVEDRLLTVRDACHRETELGFFSTDPKAFTGTEEFWHPPHQNSTAYEVLMEFPYSEGRIFLRTQDGRVACYDLSAP